MRSLTLSLLAAVMLVGCTNEPDDQSKSDDLRGPTKPRVVVGQPAVVESSEFMPDDQPMVPGKWYRIRVGSWYEVPVEERSESDYETTQPSLEEQEKRLQSELKELSRQQMELSRQLKELSSLAAKSTLLATELNQQIDQLKKDVETLEQSLNEQETEVSAESE